MSNPELSLQEEVLLLAMADEEGTPEFGTWYRQAVAAAAFAELLLHERIAIGDDKQSLVRVLDDAPLRDEVLDFCLRRIRDDKKQRPATHWVALFAGVREVYAGVTQNLCRLGILRQHEKKVLFFFTRETFPEVDSRPEAAVIERLRRAIFTDQDDLDPRTVVLVAIANQAGILKAHFDKNELKERKARIDAIIRGEVTSAAMEKVAQAALAAQTSALFMIMMVPTIIHTSH